MEIVYCFPLHKNSDGMQTGKSISCVLMAVLLVVLAGCGEKEQEIGSRQLAGGKYAGGVYHINMVRGDPNALDPVLINSKLADDIALQIYDRLLSLDSNLNLIPELATQWEISEDGLLYTFRLRTDVSFHDNACFPDGKGRKMTAQDVRYSLERCCDPATRSVQFWAFKDKVAGATEYYEAKLNGQSTGQGVSGLQALDDSTFQIRLVRPYAPFLYYLVNSLGCVVPHEAVEKYGKDYFQHPVGTGPFVFVEWKHDQSITLTRNPSYWQKDEAGNQLPLLDEVQISFIKDDKIQLTEFSKGTLDECFGIPTEFFPFVVDGNTGALMPEYRKYTLQAKPAMLSWFFDFLCTKPPFDKADVRRAFSYAIDREKIVKYVLRNAPYAPAMHGITPPVIPGYDIAQIPGYTIDETKAREYMAKAGYPNGKGFPAITMSVYPEPRLLQVAEAVKDMLEKTLNISVNIRIIQFAQLLELAEAGKLEFWGTRWYGDYPDAENYLNLYNGALVPKDDSPSYPNSTRYNNPAFTALLNQAVETSDSRQRNELYRQAETIAMQDAPAIMLFYEMHYRLLQAGVRGNPLDPMNRVILKYVWFNKEKA
jgi:oligopeptide transport system substrate-binding protein